MQCGSNIYRLQLHPFCRCPNEFQSAMTGERHFLCIEKTGCH